MSNDQTTQGGYVLGHSEFELKRLARQAEMIDPITRRFLERAGIVSGMHVLDVGSGAGDVAFLLAERVGPAGSVVGIERVPAALETARRRAADRGLSNVSFIEGEPGTLQFAAPFDAAIGRYVLMFQPDPVMLLRSVASVVRQGGLVAFHEPDWRGVGSDPESPTYDQCCQWIIEALIRTRTEHQMGFKLHRTFLDAGLPAPSMAVEAQIGGGSSAQETWELIADLTFSMADAIQACGAATADEMQVHSLHARIRSEVESSNAILMGRFEVGAWSRA